MDRNKRVKLLKKIIIGTVLLLIILPTVLSVVLFIKVNSLNNSLRSVVELNVAYNDEVRILNTQVIEQQIEVDELTSKLADAVIKQNEMSKQVELAESSPDDNNSAEVWPKKVYLTFDDGPSGHTQDILDILDRYDVKGNFFVCHTNNEEYQKYYKKIIDEGHMLGVHSYSHEYDKIYSSEEAFEEDVSKMRDFIYEVTDGYIADYYRFPGGSDNLTGRLSISSCIDFLNRQGMTYFDWNVSSDDATNPMQKTEVIYDNCTSHAGEYEEVMILMHDLGNKDSTVEALPKVIEYYKDLGSEISIIDNNTKIIQHYNN